MEDKRQKEDRRRLEELSSRLLIPVCPLLSKIFNLL